MGGSYFWATAVGVVGVVAVAAAAVLSVVGMMQRHPDDRLPPFVGRAFGLMILGSVSFIAALLFMAGGSP